ncbi:hypothetical protein HDA32_005586 [Spinactinospora alkalitolerans]|uniref:Uncharacterized protein n=1 Tax=Spinactinospora alkalitolerans TaxID=687207 RepID=A0A852U0U5_9ACTN|nr:hypothetical protein [Spinactinospora alkalitolerans]NYE50466.1 hypothetical protein [Spinactinospora alkalitolerans]
MRLIDTHYVPDRPDGLEVKFWSGPIDEVSDYTPYDETVSSRPAPGGVPACSRDGRFSA